MAEIVAKLADFPGVAVKYDIDKNPFFQPIVVENLRKIASVDAGKQLLAHIGAAQPRIRADFPSEVNVLVVPLAVTFVQSGH
jgi:hypothetical protein